MLLLSKQEFWDEIFEFKCESLKYTLDFLKEGNGLFNVTGVEKGLPSDFHWIVLKF